MNFFKDGKLPGKGTAAVICFCLAAVAALGIFSYNRSARELAGELSGLAESGTVTSARSEPSENVNAPAEVPMETGTEESAQSELISESEAADVPAENVPLAEDAFGNKSPEKDSDNSGQNSSGTGAPEVAVRPVSGEVINPFSEGELVKSKTLDVWKTHDGIDIAADQGTAVKSMSAGVVTSVSRDPLMGVTITIDHGSGYEGVYCNLADETKVSAGDPVEAGTVIGEVGSSAEAEISEPSHLHFGVKKNSSWINPADLLSGEGS